MHADDDPTYGIQNDAQETYGQYLPNIRGKPFRNGFVSFAHPIHLIHRTRHRADRQLAPARDQ